MSGDKSIEQSFGFFFVFSKWWKEAILRNREKQHFQRVIFESEITEEMKVTRDKSLTVTINNVTG